MLADQRGVDVGHADAVDQQWGLAPNELDRVAGEGFQVIDEPRLGLDHHVGDLVLVERGAAREASLTDEHLAVVDPEFRAVLDSLEHLGSDLVDEDDPGADEHLRSEVGVAPADGAGRIDHGDDIGLDQCVGGDAVEVDLVEDGDVARSDSVEEAAGVLVDPGDTGHARQFFGVTCEQCGHLHAPHD